MEKKFTQSRVLEWESSSRPLPRHIRAGGGKIGMPLTPTRELGTGMEPKQVAGSKEGAPVTRKKPLILPRLDLSEGGAPYP